MKANIDEIISDKTFKIESLIKSIRKDLLEQFTQQKGINAGDVWLFQETLPNGKIAQKKVKVESVDPVVRVTGSGKLARDVWIGISFLHGGQIDVSMVVNFFDHQWIRKIDN